MINTIPTYISFTVRWLWRHKQYFLLSTVIKISPQINNSFKRCIWRVSFVDRAWYCQVHFSILFMVHYYHQSCQVYWNFTRSITEFRLFLFLRNLGDCNYKKLIPNQIKIISSAKLYGCGSESIGNDQATTQWKLRDVTIIL